jgi:hypothetical protein
MVNAQEFTQSLFTNFNNHNSFLNIDFVSEQKQLINPFSYKINYQLGNMDEMFQKINAEINTTFSYNKPKKGLSVRLALGFFIDKPAKTNDETYYRMGNDAPKFDYMFDEMYFGRSENAYGGNSMGLEKNTTTIFANQIRQGGPQIHVLGYNALYTDSWFTSANLHSTLPGKIPLRVYLDAGLINKLTNLNNVESYSIDYTYTGGIALWLFDGVFQVHVPMFASNDINEFWELTNTKFHQRINFSLNLNRLQPIKLLQSTNLF